MNMRVLRQPTCTAGASRLQHGDSSMPSFEGDSAALRGFAPRRGSGSSRKLVGIPPRRVGHVWVPDFVTTSHDALVGCRLGGYRSRAFARRDILSPPWAHECPSGPRLAALEIVDSKARAASRLGIDRGGTPLGAALGLSGGPSASYGRSAALAPCTQRAPPPGQFCPGRDSRQGGCTSPHGGNRRRSGNVCRDAVSMVSRSRGWVAAWQAAYAGACRDTCGRPEALCASNGASRDLTVPCGLTDDMASVDGAVEGARLPPERIDRESTLDPRGRVGWNATPSGAQCVLHGQLGRPRAYSGQQGRAGSTASWRRLAMPSSADALAAARSRRYRMASGAASRPNDLQQRPEARRRCRARANARRNDNGPDARSARAVSGS